MNRIKPILFWLVVLQVIFFTSCSPTRKIIKEPLKTEGTEFLLKNLKTNELNYNFLSAKFNSTFAQNKKENQITGQIRIKRDSLIWISISPLMGIEMARILISNDSILYVNRIENTYFRGTFDYINKLINSTLDFDMLQSFLTGNDFSRYENTSFRGGIDNNEYTLATSNRRKLKKFIKGNNEINIPIQHIWLDPQTFKISRIMIREAEPKGRKVDAAYTHSLITGQLVPVTIKLDIEMNDNKTSMDINYSKIVLGESLQFPFKIPANYKRVQNF